MLLHKRVQHNGIATALLTTLVLMISPFLGATTYISQQAADKFASSGHKHIAVAKPTLNATKQASSLTDDWTPPPDNFVPSNQWEIPVNISEITPCGRPSGGLYAEEKPYQACHSTFDPSDRRVDVVVFLHPTAYDLPGFSNKADIVRFLQSGFEYTNETFSKVGENIVINLVGVEDYDLSDFPAAMESYVEVITAELISSGSSPDDAAQYLRFETEFINNFDISNQYMGKYNPASGQFSGGFDAMHEFITDFDWLVNAGKTSGLVLPEIYKQYRDYGVDVALIIHSPYAVEHEGEVVFDLRGVAGYIDNGRLDNVVLLKPAKTVIAHEFGHIFQADHEREVMFDPEGYAHASTCGGKKTAMWHVINSDLTPDFSNPDTFINGEPCGEDGLTDNDRIIAEHAPVYANVRDQAVTIGTVSLDHTEYQINEADGVLDIRVSRDGDVSQATKVYLLLNGPENLSVINSDELVEIKFAPEQAEQTVKISLKDTASNYEDQTVTAELVFPRKLTVEQGSAIIRVANDDVKPTPKPTPEPEVETGTSGGALGWISMLVMGLVAIRRYK